MRLKVKCLKIVQKKVKEFSSKFIWRTTVLKSWSFYVSAQAVFLNLLKTNMNIPNSIYKIVVERKYLNKITKPTCIVVDFTKQ